MTQELVPLLSRGEIQKRVNALAIRISADYGSTGLVVLGVLKGAFVFLADLIREMSIPIQVEFIQVASYGAGMETSGEVKPIQGLEISLEGRHVLVVEDIIDSGLTIAYLVDHLKKLRPQSIRVCAFIDKRGRREVDVPIDYVGHVVDSGFLVGYGLDYAEEYRGLPGLYHLKL